MAYDLITAAKMSRDPLASSVCQAVATVDESLSRMIMEPTPGKSHTYTREKALPTAAFVSPTHTSVGESHFEPELVTAPLRLLVDDVDIYNFVEEQESETIDQVSVQLEKKLKAVGRAIANKAINGGHVTGHTLYQATDPFNAIDAIAYGPHLDSVRFGPGAIKYTHAGTLWQFRAPGDIKYGPTVAAASDGSYVLKSDNPNKWIKVTLDVSDATGNGETSIAFTTSNNEPDGLNKLITPAQTIASSGADGDDISFALLDRMIDEMVKSPDQQAFVVNSKLKGKILNLNRSLGGALIGDMALEGYNARVPVYRGRPILQNDWIGSAEAKGASTTLSSAYLVSFAPVEGFYACVGARGGAMDINLSPLTNRVMGIRIREIGQLEGKEADRRRVSWYGNFCLGSDLAASRASELKTA